LCHTAMLMTRLQGVCSRAYFADVTKRFFTIRMSHAVRYKHKCKFIYVHKKCTVLLSSLNSAKMCIGISYTEFNGNREINVRSSGRHSRGFSQFMKSESSL
jgi:hypothetical protein